MGCSPGGADTGSVGGEAPWDRGPNPHALDDVLRFDHVQVKGTHNSYHQEPANPVDDSHRYSQPTLTDQLDLHHVRQLELDLHLTEQGQWHVFHIPGIDQETSCLAFVDCLQEIRDWSDAHGWHLPITVWLEPKDDVDALVDGYQSIEGEALLTVDDAIREVWPEERLFRSDDLRGEHDTLPAALAAEGWPTLGVLRGRILFALLDAGRHRDTYTAGASNLAGRVLFVDSSSQNDPFAALVKDGSPVEITEWVQAGFAITDNGSAADDDPVSAEAADSSILAAGVHHAATDLAAPTTPYWLDLAPRCNPVRAPAECDDAEIEKLD